ncbi:DUF503 family protein [Geotoga petraea]|jgi:uncharacterized protein YlxP (DUF503 family)|uniref:DUF503 domain-containing protein n=1 Tax=Geotoga petraea TaxID=28234 RepID=A0A1G6JK13_9BACT|nr:DUF503 family protein [Geotoga petraea]MDK2945384.1 uncharacterized protein [Geotoga sp.]TGG88241.1 DUF503 domain-containing protein [Geotoga petraea]SDC18978.1 hypothetical protein SAMN04488588_0553 [Geotoga petraea]
MVKTYCLKSNITTRIRGLKSLKEKRSIVKRMKNMLDKYYNASVIESDFNDSHEFISLTYSIVSKDKDYLLNVLENIEERIEVEYGVSISEHLYDIF